MPCKSIQVQYMSDKHMNVTRRMQDIMGQVFASSDLSTTHIGRHCVQLNKHTCADGQVKI